MNLGEIENDVSYYNDQSSEEDSDYEPEFIESEEDNEVDSELEPEEVIAEDETEFLPQFKKFFYASYDCTKEAMIGNVQASFDDDMKLMVGQEWPNVKKYRKHLRDFGIKNKFVIWLQKNNVDKLICKCKDRSCPWRCYVRRLNDGHTMVCKSLVEEHTCVNDRKNNNLMANDKWIA